MKFSLRKTLKFIFRAFLSLVLLVALLVFVASKVCSIPGEEKIPSGEKRNQSLYVEMGDGVKIAVDIWLPKDHEKGAKIPTLLQMTRYQRAMEVGGLQRAAHGLGLVNIEEDLLGPFGRFYNKNGYAFVLVDARGSGASFGSRMVELSPGEIADYGEIIDWISKQSWSNGKVGTIGISYDGNTAEMAAVPNPPALKAVAPLYNDFDPQYGLLQPGGVSNSYIEKWGHVVGGMDDNDICLLAEVEGLGCSLLKLWIPGVKPVDADKGRSLLKMAIEEHRKNPDIGAQIMSSEFRDDPLGETDYSFSSISPYGFKSEIESSGVPMYVWAGWLDAGTVDGALSRFLTFNNSQQIVIGAFDHGGMNDTDPFNSPDHPVSPTLKEQYTSKIEFFDKILKEEDKGFVKHHIRYYTMGEGVWRETTTWPPNYVDTLNYYFNESNTLTRDVPDVSDAYDTYEVDFAASTGSQNRWFTNLGEGDVVYPNRAKEDQKLLSYTTAPLDSNLEITGNVIIHLSVASTHEDGAFFCYLEDVDPDGKVTYITEGMLRAIHRKISTAPEPYVSFGPNHSFEKNDALPLVPGEIAELSFKLYATSVQIKKGHSIRIALAGADASIFNRFPAEGNPAWKIYHNRNQLSKVVLPVRR